MAKLTSEQIDNITLKPREVNKGTPRSIIDAADTFLGRLPTQEELGLRVDKEVKNPDGTVTIYFTSNAQLVPHVAQHDIDTCCGTTANNVQNLAYVQQLEAKVRVLNDLMGIYQCDTILQFHRYIAGLTKRCEALTQQVNQFKQNPFNGGSF